MTSRRKLVRNGRASHEFQLRSEGDALKKAARHRQKRLARKEIRKEDAILVTALSNFRVGDSNTSKDSSGLVGTGTGTGTGTGVVLAPVLGAPIVSTDRDVQMGPKEKRGRIRKPCKKCRERRAKRLRRKSQRSTMSGIVVAAASGSSSKSVRFNVEVKSDKA